jgi:FkbM family methyltransferase
MGYHDVNFSNYIKNQTDPVILDIGSYNASDAVGFKKQFPGGSVYAIEASRSNFDSMQWAISHGVNIRHLAFGEKNEEITFNFSYGAGNGSGSILKPSAQMSTTHAGLLFGEEKVMCMTIEEFCKQENIERIDCIHIDAQGADGPILKHLGKFRPDCIYAETCEFDIYEGAGTLQNIDEYMESIGYRVECRVGAGNRIVGPGEQIWNTLYVFND